MNEETMLALMSALDNGTNVFGALKPEIRARIFAAVSQPSQETWENARSIMISNERFRTLWQAVVRHTDYRVTSNPVEGWPAIPTAEQIMAALLAELSDQG